MKLIFTCKSKEGFEKFKSVIVESDFYADDFSSEFYSFAFNCSSQDDADSLEMALTELLSNNYGIGGGYFEIED